MPRVENYPRKTLDSSQRLRRLIGVREHQTVNHATLLEVGLAVLVVVDDVVAITVGNAGSVRQQGSPAGLHFDLLSGLLSPDSGGVLAHNGLNLEGTRGDVVGSDCGAVNMGVGLGQLGDGDDPVLADSAGELDAVLSIGGVVGLFEIIVELRARSNLLGGDHIGLLLELLHIIPFYAPNIGTICQSRRISHFLKIT